MSKNKETFSIRKRILPTLLISSLLPFITTISVPIEIFANNSTEFIFNLSDFLLPSLYFFIPFSLLFFFILLGLPEKAYRIFSATLISLSVMFFIQGTYLNGNLNSLQGDNMGTEGFSVAKKVFNTILWVAVITISIIFACIKKKKNIISYAGIIASVIVIATQIMTPLSIALSNPDVFLPLSERLSKDSGLSHHKILSYQNITKASNNKNIYYFCIDRFDELYAEHAYEQKPEIFEELTGFTWFKDNISIYGHTYPAVANMLTLKDFDPSEGRAEYLKDVYTDNKTLSVLSENNYSINLYTDSYYSFLDAANFPSYVENAVVPASYKVTSSFGLAFGMIQTSLYRGAPSLLKSAVGEINSSTCNNFVLEKDKNNNQAYQTSLSSSYYNIMNKNFETTDKNNFSFIHVSGCHDVSYCLELNNLQQQSKNIVNTVETNFEIINKYIKYLKEQNLYEDAIIIITGDHGHPVNDNNPQLYTPRQTALFVKPAGKSLEDMAFSQAQTSHDNIWATIMKSANITTENDYGTSVFDIPEGENQTRRYVWHTYSEDFVESTYTITGNGSDFDNWKLTSKKTFYGRKVTD